ncbi:hypothetical protein C4K35_3695 [Pseudomonas chlororaphis subsp. piscium]|nr:hypothetical protein C4K35_3695 [Pseudomonas chlororaphis subsp. piscium]AZC64080.1 hypothetical protein C4K33_3590 [Pseudomonas chlororaphis subsp. piscium]
MWSLDHAEQPRAAIGRFASGKRNRAGNGPARERAQEPDDLET